MSKMLATLALSGNKDAGIAAAADEVRTNAVQVILHGNRRNFSDTAEALRTDGAITKGGAYAQNAKGDVLGALIMAEGAALSAQAIIRPVFKGKPDAVQISRANDAAQGIADAFINAVQTSREARKVSRSKASKDDAKAKDDTSATAKDDTSATGEVVPTADNDAPAKLRAMVSSLTDERDALAAQLESVTAERDALAAQLEALRTVQAMPMAPKRANKGEALPLAA